VHWALGRFHMGCSRPRPFEAHSDYLLGLRALLDATSDTGRASIGLRLAALCAEEGERRLVQHRVEDAFVLERKLMGGAREGDLSLVAEIEGYLRALLRDILCGYLDSDLKAVADDILLETAEPMGTIRARDLREPERSDVEEPVTDEVPALAAPARATHVAEWRPASAVSEEPAHGGPEGVTPSEDWLDDDPDSYSAPV
jgi:hypothetical protein